MKIKLLALPLTLSLAHSLAEGQVTLAGTVRDETGGAAEFVSVALVRQSDTTAVVCGTITDTRGDYRLPAARPGLYYVVLSAVGFERQSVATRLRMPSAGTELRRDFTVRRAEVELGEVTAAATRRGETAGRTVYTFSRSEMAKARNAADLVSTTPDLMVDPQTERIAMRNAGGGRLKILLNGVAATDEDLKAVSPEKVVRCEYFTIPPARYATVQAVVNVVTRSLDTGWAAGADATTAVSTGFVNGSTFARVFGGKRQFGADYTISHRDYRRRVADESYAFALADVPYRYDYHTTGAFGYTTQSLRLKYSLGDGESATMFQAIAIPGFERRFSNADQDLRRAVDGVETSGTGTTRSRLSDFNPSLDLYLVQRWGAMRQLDLNVVGTYHGTRHTHANHVAAGDVAVIDDDMEQNTDKASVIAEAAHMWAFDVASSLSVGYRGEAAWSRAAIANSLTSRASRSYRSDNSEHYLYAEYSGGFKSLTYRVSVGATLLSASNDGDSYTHVVFRPNVVVAKSMSGGQTLQFQYMTQAEAPTISQLADNAAVIIPGVLRRGNPSLESNSMHGFAFVYRANTRQLDVSAGALGGWGRGAFAPTYERERLGGTDYIVRKTVNAKQETNWGFVASAAYRPLAEWPLRLLANAMAIYADQELSDDVSVRRWYAPVNFGVEVKTKKWGASYSGGIVGRKPDGLSVTTDEPKSHLSAYWQIRRVRLRAGCLWLLSEARYDSWTVPNSVMDNSSKSRIGDNRNMITVGVSINLDGGKWRDEVKPKLSNADGDTGSF